jgi:anti-sigma-K factor RskA
MSEHRTPDELAAAYALGALSDDERAEYEAWLASTPDAAADASAFSDVAAALGLATEPAQPSADLRSRLLAQIATTPQQAPLAETAEPATPAAEPVEAANPPAFFTVPPVTGLPPADVAPESEAIEPSAGPAEQRARARWTRTPAALLVAAAAAILLFVGGGFAGSLISQNNFEVAQATALAEIQSASDAEEAVAQLPDGSTATLIWSLEQRRSAVLIDELPALPSGQTYQLWYIGADGPIPDGTFDPAQDGKTWRVLDGFMTGGDAVGITVEPEGGSEEPTTDPIVVIASA